MDMALKTQCESLRYELRRILNGPWHSLYTNPPLFMRLWPRGIWGRVHSTAEEVHKTKRVTKDDIIAAWPPIFHLLRHHHRHRLHSLLHAIAGRQSCKLLTNGRETVIFNSAAAGLGHGGSIDHTNSVTMENRNAVVAAVEAGCSRTRNSGVCNLCRKRNSRWRGCISCGGGTI